MTHLAHTHRGLRGDASGALSCICQIHISHILFFIFNFPFERAQKLARIVQIAASSQFVEKTENIESLSAANRIFSDILRHTYAQRVFYFQFLFGECECLAFEN